MPEDDRERALEEGPLPFLFRMDVDAFKRRYQAVLKEETDRYYRLGIYPLHPVDREAFYVAALYLDKRTLLPLKISTLAPNMKDTQDYVIKKVMLNDQLAHVTDRTFSWTAETEQWARQQNPPWKIVRNPPPGQAAIQQAPPPLLSRRRRRPGGPSAVSRRPVEGGRRWFDSRFASGL